MGVYLTFCTITGYNSSIFTAVFVNADPNKAGLSCITNTPNVQPDDTSSTTDKDDETKQTRECVDSTIMDQNDSKQKTQKYSRLSKTTNAINLVSKKPTSSDQLSPCRATTDMVWMSENQTKKGKF